MPAACWTHGKLEHTGGGVNGTATATVTYPSGGAAGHIVLLFVAAFGTYSAPSGWTTLYSTNIASNPFSIAGTFKVYGKQLDGTEPASFTLAPPLGGDRGICWGCVRVEALLDGGEWFDDSAGVSGTNVVSSLDVERTGSVYLWAGVADDNTGLTEPSGFCRLENREMNFAFAAEILVAAKRFDTTGATGTVGGSGSSPRAGFGILIPAFVPLDTGDEEIAALGRISYDGLHTINITDPTNPTLLDSFEPHSGTFTGEVVDITWHGDYIVCLNNGDDSLFVIDASDPSNLVEAGHYKDTITFTELSAPKKVRMMGDYAVVTNNAAKCLYVFDLSDPTTPTLVGSYDRTGDVDGFNNA